MTDQMTSAAAERKDLEQKLHRLRLERLGINVLIREVKHSIRQLIKPKTHCPSGHELTIDNTVMRLDKSGRRYPACLMCRREQRRNARKKNPEAAREATRRWRARERLKKAKQ